MIRILVILDVDPIEDQLKSCDGLVVGRMVRADYRGHNSQRDGGQRKRGDQVTDEMAD